MVADGGDGNEIVANKHVVYVCRQCKDGQCVCVCARKELLQVVNASMMREDRQWLSSLGKNRLCVLARTRGRHREGDAGPDKFCDVLSST